MPEPTRWRDEDATRVHDTGMHIDIRQPGDDATTRTGMSEDVRVRIANMRGVWVSGQQQAREGRQDGGEGHRQERIGTVGDTCEIVQVYQTCSLRMVWGTTPGTRMFTLTNADGAGV